MEIDETLKTFVDETREQLASLDRILVALEDHPEDVDQLDDAFRAMHSIKGNAGFFGFGNLKELAHAAENLLSLVRNGRHLDARAVRLLYGVVDAARQLVDTIESTGEEPDADYGELVEQLDDYTDYESGAENASSASPVGDSRSESGAEHGGDEEPRTGGEASDSAVESDRAESTRHEPESLRTGSTRVDVDLLDRLMNQTSELVLTRNRLRRLVDDRYPGSDLQDLVKKLERVTSDLQRNVLETRMQPIRHLWRRYPRMVRDWSARRNREVRLELQGGDTELDRNVMESIVDPVTHLVRNAIDHGIEPPEVRAEKGKRREGVVRLSAYQREGSVYIEVSDDGAGMDTGEIVDQAIDQGVVPPSKTEELTEDQIFEILYASGFSTSDEVTELSGRGFGLDVVRRNIEALDGTVSIETEDDRGTSVTLKLPLTLAVVAMLQVESGGQKFVVPRSNVRRLARVEEAGASDRVELIRKTPVFLFGDRWIPLVFLDRLLGAEASDVRERLESARELQVVVLRGADVDFALAVDAVRDIRDTVVKSVEGPVQAIELYSGATILGDGRIALILDPAGIVDFADLAGAGKTRGERFERDRTESDPDTESTGEGQDVLWCRSRDDGRFVVPLDRVNRLVHFERDELDARGGVRFARLDDEWVPLVDVEDVLPERRSEPRNEQVYRQSLEQQKLPVILHELGSRRVGFVVTEFLEVVRADLSDRHGVSREGVKFCAVVRDTVAEVLDIEEIVRRSELDYETSR